MPEAERKRATAHVSDRGGGGPAARGAHADTPAAGDSVADDGVDARGPRLPANPAEWLRLLGTGDVEVEGRLPWSSNYSFLAAVTCEDMHARAVYKPGQGERHLWDFGLNLYRREVAAYELSAALGLGLVPETVLRSDAPFEEGSLQRFIDADFEQHYFSLLGESAHDTRLRELAGFDVLVNNADRKGGHVLIDVDGAIWGIDNGLCFHSEPKLRTVMWDFAGEALPESIIAAAATVLEGVPETVCRLISPAEVDALLRRARAVVRRPRFPAPGSDYRAYPWPLV